MSNAARRDAPLEDDLAVGVVEGEVGGKRLCGCGVDSAGPPAEVKDHVRQIEREPGTPDVLASESGSTRTSERLARVGAAAVSVGYSSLRAMPSDAAGRRDKQKLYEPDLSCVSHDVSDLRVIIVPAGAWQPESVPTAGEESASSASTFA